MTTHAETRPVFLGYDDMVRVLRTGTQWRHLRPTAGVAPLTVFKTMHEWIDAGAFRTAYKRLLRLYRRRRWPRYCCVNSTFGKSVYGPTFLDRAVFVETMHALRCSILHIRVL